MDWINIIIENTIASFDFGLVVIINLATYMVVKLVDEVRHGKRSPKWFKRFVLCVNIVLISVVYHFIDGSNDRLIINSAILSPMFWRWIGKPIAKKVGIDYKN